MGKMKVFDYLKLAECAMCPYSFKKESKPLLCNWDENKKKAPECKGINDCGSFPVGTINIRNNELN